MDPTESYARARMNGAGDSERRRWNLSLLLEKRKVNRELSFWKWIYTSLKKVILSNKKTILVYVGSYGLLLIWIWVAEPIYGLLAVPVWALFWGLYVAYDIYKRFVERGNN